LRENFSWSNHATKLFLSALGRSLRLLQNVGTLLCITHASHQNNPYTQLALLAQASKLLAKRKYKKETRISATYTNNS
jgi:hypothetical protein